MYLFHFIIITIEMGKEENHSSTSSKSSKKSRVKKEKKEKREQSGIYVASGIGMINVSTPSVSTFVSSTPGIVVNTFHSTSDSKSKTSERTTLNSINIGNGIVEINGIKYSSNEELPADLKNQVNISSGGVRASFNGSIGTLSVQKGAYVKNTFR